MPAAVTPPVPQVKAIVPETPKKRKVICFSGMTDSTILNYTRALRAKDLV